MCIIRRLYNFFLFIFLEFWWSSLCAFRPSLAGIPASCVSSCYWRDAAAAAVDDAPPRGASGCRSPADGPAAGRGCRPFAPGDDDDAHRWLTTAANALLSSASPRDASPCSATRNTSRQPGRFLFQTKKKKLMGQKKIV